MKEYERQEKERHDLLLAVGEAISAWSRVEAALQDVFHICIGGKALGPTSAAFIAIENFRSKLAVCDAVVKAHLGKNQLIGFWEKQFEQTRRLSRIRNTLAHGQVVILKIGNSQSKAFVMGSLHDYSSKGTGWPAVIKKTRLNLKQVNEQTVSCISLARNLAEFCKKVPRY